MGWLGRWVWFLGWGCGIPEPLGICVAGYPDINPYVPSSMWSHPWANVAGYPDCLAHRPRDTRAIHIEVYGAGPDRADARRSLKAIMHRLEIAPHVWWLLGEAPGTGMSQKFSLFRWRSETVR
jgi:hypothetical protein